MMFKISLSFEITKPIIVNRILVEPVLKVVRCITDYNCAHGKTQYLFLCFYWFLRSFQQSFSHIATMATVSGCGRELNAHV